MADPADIVHALGLELEAVRQQNGLTRREAVQHLHERTGVQIAASTLLTYEHAIKTLSVQRLLELAAGYQVSPSWLLEQAIRRAGGEPGCPTCGRE